MVASKRIHCAICDKKCSGKVLRYQDQYYHKQCFELEQSEAGRRQQEQLQQQYHLATNDSSSSTATALNRSQNLIRSGKDELDGDSLRASSKSQQLYTSNNNNNNPSALSGGQRNESNSATLLSQSQRQLNGGGGGGDTSGLPPITSSSSSSAAAASRHYYQQNNGTTMQTYAQRGQTLDPRGGSSGGVNANNETMITSRAATLPHSSSSPANGFSQSTSSLSRQFNTCAGCKNQIKDGQALIALDLHWHVWCFKCAHCKVALHGEYVAKDGRAYCEKDYQKLFGVTCVYCKRYITGKVLQAGEAHHFHPSCARCSKCGDPFVPGEEMYLQGEVTWHPRCGPGPESAAGLDESTILGSAEPSSRSQLRSSRAQSPSLSSRSHSRSVSPFSFMSRQYGRASPGYAESEALGDLSRVYTISYLDADPTQGYLRRPIEPKPPKSPQFSRPTSAIRGGDRSSRSSSRSQYYNRERSVPRGMYSVLSSMRSDCSNRARSPSMLNEEAIQSAQYPSGQKPSPDAVPAVERDDFPAPPFPYPNRSSMRSSSASKSNVAADTDQRHVQKLEKPAQQQQQQQQRASRPRSREIVINDDDEDSTDDPQLTKEEEELSKIANGIGKVFLQTLKEREKLRAWRRSNLDPRNASRTPSATRELPSRLRYDNPTNASPSRDMDRPRPWEEDETGGAATSDHSPSRTRSSLGRPATGTVSSNGYGYKVVQSNRSTPRPGYGLSAGPYESVGNQTNQHHHQHVYSSENGLLEGKHSEISFNQQQRLAENRSNDLLNRAAAAAATSGPTQTPTAATLQQSDIITRSGPYRPLGGVSAHLRRSMPNGVDHLHQDGPPKLYPYHLLATSNYRLPPDVDRCHLERHLSNEEFQYIFHCDRLDFYRLPAWKRNELKRRVKLF